MIRYAALGFPLNCQMQMMRLWLFFCTINNDFVNYCLFLGKMLISRRKYPVKY